MNRLKNIAFSTLYMIITILVMTFIITIFNYFGLFSKNIVSIFKIIIPMLALFIGGFSIGKKSNKKGWLEGLILSIVFIIILLIFNFLAFNNTIEFKNLLYYFIMMVSCIFGSMLGINKNIEN